MTEQVASDRSLSSRLVFLVAGAATGIAMSQAGVGGIWLAVGAVALLIVFGELYIRFFDR